MKLAVVVIGLALLLVACEDGGAEDVARIAFISDRDGNQELYVMNADGSNLKRLTDTEHNEQNPSWSPDGTKIAFVAESDGGLPLYKHYVMDADGTGLVEVAEAYNMSRQAAYDWSPDGTQFAIGAVGARVVNVDGSGEVVLAPGPRPAQSFDPLWSPDGSQIVFWGQNGADRALYFADPDGSNLTRFTEDGTRANWSPDGTKLGYWYSVPGSGTSATHIMNPDGSELVNLTEILDMRMRLVNKHWGVGLGLAWSPDSSMFAFASDDEGDLDLYTTTIDGSTLVKLTEGLGVGESLFTQIVWSPDGSKIALAARIDDHLGADEIYVASTDGSGYENVTNTSYNIDQIIGWSADSSRIYYQAWRGEPIEDSERLLYGDADIFVMNADGSGVENLSKHPKTDAWAALWLPDSD